MKHLRSHDNRLLHLHAFTDQHTLDTRDLLGRNLDTQVTTSDHNAISHFQNLLDIVYTLLILDLSDNLDRAVTLVQDTLDIQYVLFVANK